MPPPTDEDAEEADANDDSSYGGGARLCEGDVWLPFLAEFIPTFAPAGLYMHERR